MGFFRHKCLLKIYIFILKIFSFSFVTKRKRNKRKFFAARNCLPALFGSRLLRPAYFARRGLKPFLRLRLCQTVWLQQGIAKRYFLIDFCSTYYLGTAFLHYFAPLSILNSQLTLGFGANKNNFW